MRIAMIQMAVTADKGENLRRAREKILALKDERIDLAVLPEMFCCPYSNDCFCAYGEPAGGEAWQMLRDTARELGIWLVGGSMPELEEDRVYNTSFVFDRSGRQIARHRKAHLFDIQVEGGQHFRESETLSAGNEVTVFDTEFGTIGVCICFDFRFQELAKVMGDRGATLIVVPAAFNMTTGPAHWELMFRQRAVDNQLFTLGVAPARNETAEYVSYANSLVCDPMGRVLTRAEAEPCILYAQLDPKEVDSARRQLPLLSARRTDLYSLK